MRRVLRGRTTLWPIRHAYLAQSQIISFQVYQAVMMNVLCPNLTTMGSRALPAHKSSTLTLENANLAPVGFGSTLIEKSALNRQNLWENRSTVAKDSFGTCKTDNASKKLNVHVLQTMCTMLTNQSVNVRVTFLMIRDCNVSSATIRKDGIQSLGNVLSRLGLMLCPSQRCRLQR